MATIIRGSDNFNTSDVVTPSDIIGVGQTWQNVSGSRVSGTTYTNNTGKPITVMANCLINSTSDLIQSYVDDLLVSYNGTAGGTIEMYAQTSFIVPDGSTYKIVAQGGAGLILWSELR